MTRTETAPQQLAVGQMIELEKQYEQLKEKLELWRGDARKFGAQLAELETKQDKAEKLLAFTKNIQGCSSERELAEIALEKCADQRPRLEQLLESTSREVKRQEEALERIDVKAFAPLAKIRALATGL
jgi:predicted  nucleic acid-binding Zn-ribbon protein